MRINLFLMRHSRSCSNHMRHVGSEISAQIRDPGLTVQGRNAAAAYGPILRERLEKAGFRNPIVCASTLKRAQETARLVFGSEPRVISRFSENGVIPENTPVNETYQGPDWNMFLAQLRTFVTDGASVSMVGHGSYLRSLWPMLTGSERAHLNNLDGILCVLELTEDAFKVLSYKEIDYSGPSDYSGDTCTLHDTEKITRLNRMGRKQNGGMSLGYFKDGAQMQGTYAEETGVQGPAWFRPALSQTGGFSPSVMGSFATNGLRLVPLAAYMGYKMYSKTKTSKSTKSKRTRKYKKTRKNRK